MFPFWELVELKIDAPVVLLSPHVSEIYTGIST